MNGHDDTAGQLAQLRTLADTLRQAQAQTAGPANSTRRELERVVVRAWNKGRGMSQPAIATAIGYVYSVPMLAKIVGKRPATAPRRRGVTGSPELLAELAAAADAYRAARDARDRATKGPREALIIALRAAWNDGEGIDKNDLLQAIDYLWTRQWLDIVVGTVAGQRGARKGRWHPTSRTDPNPPPRGDAP